MIFSSMNLTYGFSTEQTVHYIPESSHLCRCIRVLLEYLTHFGYILFMFSISFLSISFLVKVKKK